jgi:hypothetical protein
MPFPDPLLPIAIVATMGALIIPTCLHLVREWKGQKLPNENPPKTESRTGTHQEYDPFSDHPELGRDGHSQEQIRIKTMFISCGSQTQELSFEWIVQPFQPITEQDGRSDGEKPSS